MKNIIETAITTENLKIFLQAVMETDLSDTLSYSGPFTIFAPSDTAFQKLPSETIQQLFQDKEKLTEFLTNHIVLQNLNSTDAKTHKKIMTANGKNITLDTKKGFKINNVSVIKKDIICENGIIHIINNTILIQN